MSVSTTSGQISNTDKGLVEREFEARKQVWGFTMDNDEEANELPPVKLLKASYVLSDPRLDPGSQVIEVLMSKFSGATSPTGSL